MTILRFLFGRQNEDRPEGSASVSEAVASIPMPDTPAESLPPAANDVPDVAIPEMNTAPYGHARKIGRPMTISRPQPKPDRVKSRLMNYGQLDAVLDELEGDRGQKTGPISRPVGWLVIIEGPGTGAWFTLQSGLTQIGRGPDQTVSLNYGDTAISRATHASIAYEPADHRFRLGLGKCENDILVNGSSVHATTDLAHGDLITVGETTLRLAAFCDDRFAWAPIIDKGDQNVLSA